MKNDQMRGMPPLAATEAPRLHEAADIANLIASFMRILPLDELLPLLLKTLVDNTGFGRVVLLLHDADERALVVTARHERAPSNASEFPQHARFAWSPESDDLHVRWQAGQTVWLSRLEEAVVPLAGVLLEVLAIDTCDSVPLVVDGHLLGVLLIDSSAASNSAAERDSMLLQALAPAMATAIANAQQYSQTLAESTIRLRQLTMLRQIDRELNDNIQLDHTYAITLDWALRYTNAHAASLALFNDAAGELRYVADVGYALLPQDVSAMRAAAGMTPMHRVAQSGQAEVIPDVSADKDYLALSSVTRSQLIAPITREDRVIAVISIESKKLNFFNDDHVDFIEKLGARAGVAIDNARLFWETSRERSKLERILSSTADIIIVVGLDDTIEIMNASAIVAFGLDPTRSYSGLPMHEVLKHTALPALYREAVRSGEVAVGEVRIADDRTFYANLGPCPAIGWIIVMHDISPLKKTDRLKSEIISAVSHDLKQPLGVMHGFTELLMLNADDIEQVKAIIPQIQRAIISMRQLIDDQLDLARLESGVQLKLEPAYLRVILTDTIDSVRRMAEEKALTVHLHMPDDMLMVTGDSNLMYRIFLNVIGNAVKYTPQFGQVDVTAEAVGGRVRVTVSDNGYGISPEDQSRIFDRFFRVRRPEYDHVDGTGLGLAIVKRLVELHQGQIGVQSAPGEGATFTISLPIEHSPS